MSKVFGITNGEELTNLYLRSDVNLLTDVFEKIVKVSTKEYSINPLYCVSLPGYAYESALIYTDNKLQTLQDKDLILFLENSIRGGTSSVMGVRYVISDDNKKIIYEDATSLYGQSVSQMLTFDEIKMWHGHPDFYIQKLAEILKTPDDDGIGYFVEVDLNYPDDIKKIQKIFHLLLRIKL